MPLSLTKHTLTRSLAPLLWLAACGGDAGLRDAGGEAADAAEELDAGAAQDAEDDAAELDAGDETDADATGPSLVRIHFKGRVGSHAYGCDRVYPGQGSASTDVTGRAFRFFVSDVRLIDAAGAEVPLALEARRPAQSEELALLDFQDPEGSCGTGTATNTQLTGTVPAGTYRGIVFRVGVPQALNHGDPTLASEPLRGSGLLWNWLQGYRFFVGELASVTPLPDPSDAGLDDAGTTGGAHHFEPGLGLLHIGSTGCLGGPASGIACNRSNRAEIRLAEFDPAGDAIVVDLGAIFAGSDLAGGAQCHGRGDGCGSMFDALGIDLDTGNPLATQTVFRVE